MSVLLSDGEGKMNTDNPNKPKLKTVYVLRTRMGDSEPWGYPSYYRTRKERDRDASINRAFGGIRTHSYEEKKSAEEIEELL